MSGPASYETWRERYGDDYDDERQRRAAYIDYCTAHAETAAAFDLDADA